MNALPRLAAPLLAVGMGLIYFLGVTLRPFDTKGEMDLEKFGKLLVVEQGRTKPIDTLARVSLMAINKRQTYRDAKDDPRPAVEWLLEVMTYRTREKAKSETVPAFHVDENLRASLGLKSRAGGRYSYLDLADKADVLKGMLNAIPSREPADWNEEQRSMMDLAAQLGAYAQYSQFDSTHRVFRIENDQVLQLLLLERRDGFRYAFDEIVPRIGAMIKETQRARKVEDRKRTLYDGKLLETMKQIELYVNLSQWETETLRMVAPPTIDEEWSSLPQSVRDRGADGMPTNPRAAHWVRILRAYQVGDAKAFNEEVDALTAVQARQFPSEVSTGHFEAFFNHVEPFYQCSLNYGFVFLMACLSWVFWHAEMSRGAFWLGVLTLAIHTLALIARMWIQGRPPVTNLYSSAIFIGWGCVVLCMVIELIFRNAIGTALGALAGGATLILAHVQLSAEGDTLEMMRAVLDTNFWLATHVTCVTLGYTATFVAGLGGIAYVLLGVFTPLLRRESHFGEAQVTDEEGERVVRADQPLGKALIQITYGVACFATLLSFTGTVLGGIWADYSWGRFWGWDPKENGALLIVIMNALLLHARWAGMVRDRGVAVLAILGNIITMWSWFGTNQLGIGLHAYGFNQGLVVACRNVWLAHLVLVGIGLVPLAYWRSFRSTSQPSASA